MKGNEMNSVQLRKANRLVRERQARIMIELARRNNDIRLKQEGESYVKIQEENTGMVRPQSIHEEICQPAISEIQRVSAEREVVSQVHVSV